MPCLRNAASSEPIADLSLYHHHRSCGDTFARLEALRTHAHGSEETSPKSSATSEWNVEFDLPISLLDRLLASRIVSLDAKIKSIESWQRELEDALSCNPRTLELKRRLALARETLSGQRYSPRRLLRRLTERIGWLSELAVRDFQRSSDIGMPAKRPIGLEAALERWKARDVGSMR